MSDEKPNEIMQSEHEDTDGIPAQRVLMYGWDYTNNIKRKILVDSNGVVQTS